MAVFIVLQLLMALGWNAQPMLLTTAFSFVTAGILPYAGLSQIFPKDLSGRVSTSLNLTVFLGAFAAVGTGRLSASGPPWERGMLLKAMATF